MSNNDSNTLTLNSLFNVAIAQTAEDGSSSSCTYEKYDYVLNPDTGEYEYKVVESCSAECSEPSSPECDSYGCRCV